MTTKQRPSLFNTSPVVTVLVGPLDAALLASNPHLFDNGIHHEAGTFADSILTVSVSVSGSGSAALRIAQTVTAARATSHLATLAASAQLAVLGNRQRDEWVNARTGIGVSALSAVGHMFRSSGEVSVQIRGAAVSQDFDPIQVRISGAPN